jgi:hypothetical protein
MHKTVRESVQEALRPVAVMVTDTERSAASTVIDIIGNRLYWVDAEL